MKRYIMTLIAFSLSVMTINGAEKSDGIDAFPYRDLIEKYVASSDFDKQKDIVIATRLLSKFSKYPYLIFGAFTQEDLPSARTLWKLMVVRSVSKAKSVKVARS